MTLTPIFDQLSLDDKYQFISGNGKYIGVRSYYNYAINLYLVGECFYELWYFRQENKIEKIEKLANIKLLDQYIDQMNQVSS